MTSLRSVSARARHAASSLRCSRAEVAAVGILVAGALAALGMLWLLARPATDVAEPRAGGAVGDGTLHIDRPGAVVHVSGQVAAPGLHRLPADARVADAIEAAGGLTPSAHVDALNLARVLSDGEQLHVPSEAEAQQEQSADGPAGGSGATQADGTLDLNRATEAELQELPGIGPVLAARIVQHREANGPFMSVGELRQVSGVGEKTFQALAELLSV